jgi:hypothetical protein
MCMDLYAWWIGHMCMDLYVWIKGQIAQIAFVSKQLKSYVIRELFP